MNSITPCCYQSIQYHICLAQTNLNAIFNPALFPPLRTTFVHYNLSPINTISCVSAMDDYNYIELPQHSDCSTQSTTTLLGDRPPDINTPIIHEDPFVALPSRATNGLSYLHLSQANLGLHTLESPELEIPPSNDRLPSEQSTELVPRPVHNGLPNHESVLQRCEQYTPHIVLPMLTYIQ